MTADLYTDVLELLKQRFEALDYQTEEACVEADFLMRVSFLVRGQHHAINRLSRALEMIRDAYDACDAEASVKAMMWVRHYLKTYGQTNVQEPVDQTQTLPSA